jgi:hypothetical protein
MDLEAIESGQIPEALQPLFWDVDVNRLHIERSSHFIIGRLMEHGDEIALRFLMRTYSLDQLRETLLTNRSISRRSRCFWSVVLDVKEESCTVKSYPTPFGEYFED